MKENSAKQKSTKQNAKSKTQNQSQSETNSKPEIPVENLQAEKRKKSRLKKFLRRLFIKIILILIFLGAIVAGFFYIKKQLTFIKTEKMHTAISRTLTQASELILYKMNYSDLIAIKKSGAMGLAKSYSLVKFSGIIRVGIKNFDQIKYNFTPDRKAIKVFIPPTELLGNDIMSQKVFDEQNNIFVLLKTQEIFDEIENAKNDAARDLLEDGILDEADARAKSYITQLMRSLGFENVSVELLQN